LLLLLRRDEETCRQRWEGANWLMSSSGFPEVMDMDGMGVMSEDDRNPLKGWNKAYVR